nr:MAG TPA: hypothetical protein [Caudoviricetes sp.]
MFYWVQIVPVLFTFTDATTFFTCTLLYEMRTVD